MQPADGTTTSLISKAHDFLADETTAWATVRGARGSEADADDVPDLPPNAKLRPYQDACVLGTLAHWGSGQKERIHPDISAESKVAMVVLPTGTGKSWVIVVLAVAMAKAKRRVLIVTPNQEIRAGLIRKLEDFAPKTSNLKKVILVAQGTKREIATKHSKLDFVVMEKVDFDDFDSVDFPGANIVVSNYQTITPKLKNRNAEDDLFRFDVVIVDEAHHVPSADSYKVILQKSLPEFVCNLTATPYNYARKAVIGTSVPPDKKYTLDWAKRHNYVKTPQVVVVDRRSWEFLPGEQELVASKNLPNVEEEEDEDEENKEQKKTTDKNKNNFFHKPMHRAIAQETIDQCMRLRRLSGQPHIALAKAASIDQAEKLEALYNARYLIGESITMSDGRFVEILHSGLRDRVRENIVKRMENGEIIVCIVVGMLGEGYDNQLISVIAWHCCTKTHTRFYQFLGRGLRPLQYEHLADKWVGAEGQRLRLLGICRKQIVDENGIPRWPPGDGELNEVRQQVDLEEKEQDCVLIVPDECWSNKMQNLYDDIEGEMEGKNEAVAQSSENKNKRRRDAVEGEVETENKRKSVKPNKTKVQDEKQRLHRIRRREKQVYDAEQLDKGHKADHLFNENAYHSEILRFEQSFHGWKKQSDNQDEGLSIWQRYQSKKNTTHNILFTDLGDSEKRRHWWCHLYRRAVKELADAGTEVDHDEALKRVVFRWCRAMHNSPVLKGLTLLNDPTLRDFDDQSWDQHIRSDDYLQTPKKTPLFSNVKFKEN